MKLNAAAAFRVKPQNICQVPADSFAFTVRVSCDINFISLFGCCFQFLNQFALAADIDVLGLKSVFYIHAENAFRQIAQVPHGSAYSIIAPQKFFYCF